MAVKNYVLDTNVLLHDARALFAFSDNAVVIPHLGSATVETRIAMGMLAAENLIAALEGRRPPTLLNPEAWPR